MKKILVLDFSSLEDSGFCIDLEAEFSKKRALFNGKGIRFYHFEREINQFDLPVNSECFFGYNDNPDDSLAFKVDRYSFEANSNFSKQKVFVYLKFSNFVGYNAKEIVDYLEKEWRI